MLLTLTVANLKMIFRNRQALFWAMAFPLIFLTVFGLFNLDKPPTTTIAVIDHAQDSVSQQLLRDLGRIETFKLDMKTDDAQARQDLKDGKLRYLLVLPKDLSVGVASGAGASITFVYDEGSPTSAIVIGVIQRFLDQVNLDLVKAPSLLQLKSQGTLSRKVSYFDFLLPGFVGMGVMTYSIIGIATVMAVYREQKILKRILATPLNVRTYFAGLILSHLLLSLLQAVVILGAGILLFGGHVYGSFAYIFVLVLLGNAIFLSLGFIVGAFSNNVRAASGLGNAVTLPLMFFSGVFFPTDNLPNVMRVLVDYLPLSPMLRAMRGVALEAKPLWDYPGEIGILIAWIAVTGIVAIRVFKFR